MNNKEIKNKVEENLKSKYHYLIFSTIIFTLIITLLSHWLIPLLFNHNRVTKLVGLVVFVFIVHLFIFVFSAQIAKKEKDVSKDFLLKRFLKYVLVTLRVLLKNIVIIGLVYLIIPFIVRLLTFAIGSLAILGYLLYILLFIYLLKAFLDVIITSCIVVYESDDMRISEIRDIATDIMNEHKFFSLIYSDKFLIVATIISIAFDYIQYFIWKPNIVWQDMIGMISGSTYIIRSTTPEWWSVISTIVVSALYGITLIKLLNLCFAYYDDIDTRDVDKIEFEDNKYLPKKIMLYLLYITLVFIFLFSNIIFSTIFGTMHREEINKSQEDYFDDLVEKQNLLMEEKQKEKDEYEAKLRENLKFEIIGYTERKAPIFELINNTEETAYLKNIEIYTINDEQERVSGSTITAGAVLVGRGTAPCPIIIPANGHTYICGYYNQDKYFSSDNHIVIDYEFYDYSDVIIDGFEIKINDSSDKTNIEIINNTDKIISAMNIITLFYKDDKIIDIKRDDIIYYEWSKMINPGELFLFQEEHPISSYDDIKVYIYSAIYY